MVASQSPTATSLLAVPKLEVWAAHAAGASLLVRASVTIVVHIIYISDVSEPVLGEPMRPPNVAVATSLTMNSTFVEFNDD